MARKSKTNSTSSKNCTVRLVIGKDDYYQVLSLFMLFGKKETFRKPYLKSYFPTKTTLVAKWNKK
jgi:hypothetical protein